MKIFTDRDLTKESTLEKPVKQTSDNKNDDEFFKLIIDEIKNVTDDENEDK